MNLKLFFFVGISLLLACVSADDKKHPQDPCPQGSYEVTVTETIAGGGSISSEIGVEHIVTAKMGSEGKIERSRTETHRVCREKAEKNTKEKSSKN